MDSAQEFGALRSEELRKYCGWVERVNVALGAEVLEKVEFVSDLVKRGHEHNLEGDHVSMVLDDAVLHEHRELISRSVLNGIGEKLERL